MPDDHLEVLRSALADRYVIIAELGRGGTSVVYLADDVRGRRRVALKILRPEFLAGLTLKRFLREIEVASQLEHPNILSVLDVGDAGGIPYFAMPAVDGGSLHDLLKRDGALPFERVMLIARAIAEALDVAHAHGIVHRDIKPGNILFHDGRTMIADFGIAHALSEAGGERLTESGVSVGTPPYMSPEQGGNERGIDGRSDVYSLACVVFEMLSGEVPFNGPTALAIIAKHAHATPPPLGALRPTVTREMQEAVERGLAKQRIDRFETAGAFVRALERAQAGITARRRRWNRYAAGALAIVFFAAIGMWVSTRVTGTRAPSGDVAPSARNIAVLYFDDLTADRSHAHVAAGLTEDLIDRLSRVSALRVISTAGVRVFRDSAVQHDTVARRLNVGTLVTGSVASAGPMLRVTVRLVDARTGAQLRHQTIDRPSWDLLKLQDSVTAEVARWLREHLGPHVRGIDQRSGTANVNAWEALQRAELRAIESRALILAGNPREAMMTLTQIDSAFADAQRRDRAWPEPVVRRARTAYSRALVDTGGISAGMTRAIALADEALRLRPPPMEALAIRGEARLRLVQLGVVTPGDSLLSAAVRDLREAASARPDRARTWAALGDALLMDWRFGDAAAAYQTAFDADAFLEEMPTVMSGLMFASLYADKIDDARRWCATARRRYVDDPRFTGCELAIAGSTGHTASEVAAGWTLTQRIERADSTNLYSSTWCFRRMMIAAMLARAGMPDSARAVLARTDRDLAGRQRALSAEAYVHVLLGEPDRALELVRAFVAEQPARRMAITRHPWFRTLVGHPGFRAIVGSARPIGAP